MRRLRLPSFRTGNKALFAAMVSLLLVATTNVQAQTYHINQNFSTATGSTPPTGWVNNIITAPTTNHKWLFNNPGLWTIGSPISSPFAIFDSDYLGNNFGSGGAEIVALESPAVNTTGSPVVKLKWDQQFRCGYDGEIYVDVYDGSSWNQVYSNTTTTGYVTNTPDIDVSTNAANKTGVKVRFRFVGAYSWYWAIDNIQLYTPPICTGTPGPGNTVNTSGTPYLCSSSTSFTLGLQNATSGLTVSYQWDSSSNAISWTAISGATNATYTGTQAATRAYRCRVTCGNTGNTGTSTPIYVYNSFLGCYCIPPGADCSNWGDDITNVTLGTLSNNSGCPGPSAYSNYSTTVAAPLIVRGSTNTMLATVGAGGDERVVVWVDENQNGTFNTSEYTYLGAGNGSTITGSLSIGSAAKIGTTMMRVRLSYQTPYANSEPCISSTYGETEDYLVTILPQTPTAISGQRCGTGNAVCAVSSNTGASSPSFRWYTVATGGTAIAGQTGASLSAYSITATTPFWVSEMLDGFESPRVAVTATVNPVPTANTTNVTAVTCFNGTNGSAQGNGIGGTSPYTYSWNSSPVQNTQVATSLPVGTFTVTVTDSKTCTATATATINNASPTTIPAITPTGNPANSTICAGTNTTFTAEATGLAIAYQWQVSTGGPFNNITTGGGFYSGFTTATLTITAATPSMNGYRYRCVASGTCTPAATTTAATLTVNATVPSVSIGASATTICAGTNVNFTATPTNGGSSPSYQWRINGSPVGGNSSTFATSSLTNGQQVTCNLTSNATCPYPATVGSNSITMTVNPIITPTISISVNASAATACDGANVTFNATISGGGTAPSYQWKRNGNNVGSNSSNYSSSTLAQGDVITCQLTSNVPCPNPATVTSNPITMTIIPNVTPVVTIMASDSDICPWIPVTFTATPTHGGTAPSYQWKLNGNNVGTNSSSYLNTAMIDGDIVTAVMTSNVTCVTSPTATSNSITTTVLPIKIPGLTISATPGNIICSGTNVMFSTSPTNGGTNPVYQWMLNGLPMNGATAGVYGASVLNSGDVVSCEITSNAKCASPVTAMSNSIAFTVNSSSVPVVQVSSDKGNEIVEGETVTFTAVALNVGNNPFYKWKKNGGEIPNANLSTYTTNELEASDEIAVVVLSSDQCSNPDSVVSNSIAMLVYPLGIAGMSKGAGDMELYPNPNKGQFTVEAELTTARENLVVEVVNNLGQVVYQTNVKLSGNKLKTEIALGAVASGTYMVRIVSEGEVIMKKFIVQQ